MSRATSRASTSSLAASRANADARSSGCRFWLSLNLPTHASIATQEADRGQERRHPRFEQRENLPHPVEEPSVMLLRAPGTVCDCRPLGEHATVLPEPFNWHVEGIVLRDRPSPEGQPHEAFNLARRLEGRGRRP